MEPLKVKFMDWNCDVVFDRYKADNSIAVELVDSDTGEAIAMASLCMNTAPPGTDSDDESNCIFVKDYSENEGMTDALVDGGVIYPGAICTMQSGFVTVSAYQLTPEALERVKEMDAAETLDTPPETPSAAPGPGQ